MKTTHLILIPVFLCLISCARKGCTDDKATNYSSDAKKDDGSCTYEATINVWFDQYKSDNYQQLGVTALTLYHENVPGVTVDVYSYQASPPACKQTGTMYKTINMGGAKNRYITLEVRDQNGTVLEYIDWFANGGECENYKLF